MSNEEKINQLPAPTWNWLKMNYGTICVPEKLSQITPNADGNALHFNIKENCSYEHSITAKEGENLTVILDYTSENGAENYFAIKTNVTLEKNARLHLVKVQLLGKNTTHRDDTFAVIGSGAKFQLTQIELGAKKSFVGVYSNLAGDSSNFKSDISYYLAAEQELDMNFVAEQRGKKTQSQMCAYGSLKDAAKKTYRGTIDFKNGCAASTGNEQEETLLLSEGVVNKSIPLILCGEEDVSGEHGASIGHLDENILFYMNSRGIEKAQAEEIMARAKIMRVAANIADEKCVEKVTNFLDKIFGANA